MNKENCALKLVDEIILYYDVRSRKHQNTYDCWSICPFVCSCVAKGWVNLKTCTATVTDVRLSFVLLFVYHRLHYSYII